MSRRRLLVLLACLAGLWPFLVERADFHRLGIQVLVLTLVGLSLVVTVGWLRTVTLYQPAAVAAGSVLTTAAIGAGQAPPAALVLAALGGGAVALIAYVPVVRTPRSGLPVASLLLTALVAEYLLPRLTLVPFSRPVLLGVDLTGDRALYLAGLALVIFAALGVANLGRSDVGRQLQAVALDRALVVRSGGRPAVLWPTAMIVSGVLAGAAGWLDALLQQEFAGPRAFSPLVAVAVLAIPLLGGARWVSGALVGAAIYVAGARLAAAVDVNTAVLAAAAVAAAVLLGGNGVVGWLQARTRSPWRRAVRGPLA